MGNIVNGTRVNGYMNDFDRSFLQGLGGEMVSPPYINWEKIV